MKFTLPKWTMAFAMLFGMHAAHAQQLRTVQVRTADGVVEGVVSPDNKVRTFKGIPFAAPPVGALRWKAPQPVVPWTGVLKTADFKARSMQARIYDDMIFHDEGPSEDCLYLNLWMPEENPTGKLPVMVWIYGGGFIAGGSSEGRQDGGNLSKKGVLIVSMNYRLGIFGFFAHPELTKESGHESSGNYGLMDQMAALVWVKKNIAAFGGDPDNVTIFGESAGSFSVSALMASPLSQGLFCRAIGQSGAFFSNTLPTTTRADAEKAGVDFAESNFGTSSLEALRAKSAQDLLAVSMKQRRGFRPIIDGYYLPTDCHSLFAAGKQSKVALMAGWNKDEGGHEALFEKDAPTLANYAARSKARFGADAEAFLKAYSASTDAEAKRAAQDLGGDLFIGYSTWKWLEMQRANGRAPIYRYQFDQTLPLAKDAKPGAEARAPHAGEIEYVFQVLWTKDLPWRPEDYATSELMSSYWTNFAKTGNPNGPGLPHWPEYTAQAGDPVMHLSAKPVAIPDKHRARYEFLDSRKSAK